MSRACFALLGLQVVAYCHGGGAWWISLAHQAGLLWLSLEKLTRVGREQLYPHEFRRGFWRKLGSIIGESYHVDIIHGDAEP